MLLFGQKGSPPNWDTRPPMVVPRYMPIGRKDVGQGCGSREQSVLQKFYNTLQCSICGQLPKLALIRWLEPYGNLR